MGLGLWASGLEHWVAWLSWEAKAGPWAPQGVTMWATWLLKKWLWVTKGLTFGAHQIVGYPQYRKYL